MVPVHAITPEDTSELLKTYLSAENWVGMSVEESLLDGFRPPVRFASQAELVPHDLPQRAPYGVPEPEVDPDSREYKANWLLPVLIVVGSLAQLTFHTNILLNFNAQRITYIRLWRSVVLWSIWWTP